MPMLLADDTMDTLLMYSLAFMVAGHKVHLAHDGRGALAAAQTQEFDVILMDVGRPRWSGWEVTAAIRHLPGLEHVPVVLFNAHYDTDHQRHALRMGADRIIQKPVMPDALLAIITQWVAERTK